MTMKKISALLLAVALLLGLCGCGDFVSLMPGTEFISPASEAEEDDASETGFAEKPLLSFLGLDAFGESYYSDTPTALSYQPVVNGAVGCRSYVFDRATIIAACDCLRGMQVLGRSSEVFSSETEYVLSMNDGTEYSFCFGVLNDGSRVLSFRDESFVISGGDALFGLAFPAYNDSFDLFDLYFSDSVRAFADHFYENTPVSVGYRMSSGATITSEDPDLIETIFRLLAGATVTVVENYPDQNIDLNQTIDYIFTMADGSYYTFSFAQQCLAVRAVPGFGTVYYWMDGLSELWDIRIMSENGQEGFAGGVVGELRDDIRTTAAVVNGESDALSVAGVFVEYDIDGENGYLTLSEDTAVSFLRQVLAVSVSADTVEEPSGSRITVSVTLSDLSGPILYFTGDSIQQVVGVSYRCGSDDMFSLRSLILELAAEGNNTAEVSEGGTD